ncbi:glycosyltransferase family 10 domain-containing protein [Nostoc sp.]|uniref:glycosyltransferase family 10 domain-containing protein n=1 Tax=Nostoc sp. TaxID=1180 RepID=UPI002FFBA717
MTIKIFKVLPMQYTPFVLKDELEFLKNQGIEMTEDIGLADIILASNLRVLRPLRIAYRKKKKYLVWTSEPRFDVTFKKIDRGFFLMGDAHIMNIYTGYIFVNNFTLPFFDDFYREYWKEFLKPLDKFNFTGLDNRKIVIVAGYRNNQKTTSLKRADKELDLLYIRTQIALAGYQLGKVDIYGPGWPDNISLESSRKGDYISRKVEILKPYNFNLCFENTNFDYYCTEKIWDSIRCYCLPIYFGQGNKIYEDFPKNSFIDYSEFSNPKDLFDYVNAMTEQEFLTRMNLCINTYNTVHEKLKSVNRYEELLLSTVRRIKEIMAS